MTNRTMTRHTGTAEVIAAEAGVRKPNLFIAGAPKSGTTALFRYLAEHPQVFMPRLKEPHFFATDFRRGISDAGQYLALFEEAEDHHRILGEASVWYLYSREALRNIFRYDARCRIIVMLRNPVDLVYAKHAQLLYNFEEDEPEFEKAWRLQDRRRRGECLPRYVENPEFLYYGDIGMLGKQVERLLAIFPAGQVKIILQEDFFRDTAGIYIQTQEFLGLKDEGRRDFPRINENCVHRSQAIGRMIRKPPLKVQTKVHALERYLGLRQLWGIDAITRFNTRKQKRSQLKPGFRSELEEYFRDDVMMLSSMLGRDLSHWVN